MVLTVLIFGTCLYFAGKHRSPQEVAEAAHKALVDRDVKTLLSLTSPSEIDALGLTEQNLARFLNDYVLRGIKSIAPSGGPEPLEEDFPSVQFSLNRNYRTSDGRLLSFEFRAGESDGRVFVDGIVWSLFDGRASLERSRWADLIERDIERLNATGIKAVYWRSGHLSLLWLIVAAQERDLERIR